MKKYIFIPFLFIFVNLSFAQGKKIINLKKIDNRRYHYGFTLGGNKNTFRTVYAVNTFTDTPDVTVDANYGFNLGFIGNLKLHNNISLRFEPGLISNTKILSFNHIEGEKYEREREVENTSLHLPLLIKINANRLNNIRPYVIGGMSYNYNFSSNKKNANDNFSAVFRQEPHVFMYEMGIGMEFYLPYFKFSPSIRGIFAITNELVYDNTSSPWTDPIEFMGSRGLFLNFAFEGSI